MKGGQVAGAYVRLYHQVRTAHLERAAQLPAATIMYGNKRYDFQEDLAADLELVHARGIRAAWQLLRHPPQVLEVNEPLMLVAARSTAVALLAIWLADRLRRQRTTVVTYAIENLDPRTLAPAGVKARLARRLDLALARRIWSRVDRIAYGTAAARSLYADLLGDQGVPGRLVWALPKAEPAVSSSTKEPESALFLGAFTGRKGLSVLLQAWPLVQSRVPSARLTICGKGPLLAEARAAATRPEVDLVVDPVRDRIRELLARHAVLVLPSQPAPGWREQVGLPIVEGLAHGCTVVTTTQTGLAEWLRGHGHHTVAAAAGPAELADALVAALRAPLPVSDVLASLPDRDGRIAADTWLFDREPEPAGRA